MKKGTERQLQNLMYNVAWLRRRNGISKKRMAELLEIGVGSLNKIERGEAPPRLTAGIIFSIYKHFGIHPADLFSNRLGE